MESIILYVWQDVSGRIYKIILSGLPAVGDGLFHSWSGRSCTAFRLRLKWTAKNKNRQKSVKALLWHKHKRNGPCIISLNFCLGVRQSPFLRLFGSRHTFVQNLFGRWCVDGENRFYGRYEYEYIKKSHSKHRKKVNHWGVWIKKCTFAIELLDVAKHSIPVNLHCR